MEFRAGEHSHHIVHIAATKGSADDEFDFIIGGLGAGIGENVAHFTPVILRNFVFEYSTIFSYCMPLFYRAIFIFARGLLRKVCQMAGFFDSLCDEPMAHRFLFAHGGKQI